MEPQAYFKGYKELELKLRIKPRKKKLIREKSKALTVLLDINQV
jgi:hypothetical protein